MKIALLGAESTGKTQLSLDLATALRAQGRTVAVVTEVLREWCDAAGRTPRPEEQSAIAQEQERRVDHAAASGVDIVIADTTALMVAIYSAMLFGDPTLYPFALQRQRGYDRTLVTGLDLPWVADGLQRDGEHVRPTVDALVRTALQQAGVDHRIVYGRGDARLQHALAAVDLRAHPSGDGSDYGRWLGTCEKCSDPDCEHRLFTRLTIRPE
jgi:nicotinamide riboside kinase